MSEPLVRDERKGGYQRGEALRIVYLFGAGASHGCAKALGSSRGILMRDLTSEITARLPQLAQKYGATSSVARLVNDVIDDGTDIEQIITFLDDSGSGDHQTFADELRVVFEEVLRSRLDAICKELERTPSDLYAAVIDMHEVEGSNEELAGVLTLNYDIFLEHAIRELLGFSVDYGIAVDAGPASRRIRVLKLHGSFGWRSAWPVEEHLSPSVPLWIPPGIQKAKANYPFNLLWGMARELLDCDVLRLVGCNLGTNDWDLVSMLFAGQHVHSDRKTFDIEVIDKPGSAEEIRSRFPYLRVRSLFDVGRLGEQVVSELIGGDPRRYDELSEAERKRAAEEAAKLDNPFLYWLKQKAELMHQDLDSLATPSGRFEKILESYA